MTTVVSEDETTLRSAEMASVDPGFAARQQLEAEIRAMEAAIAAAQQRARVEEENRKREQQQKEEEQQREQQQSMEAAIAAAQQRAQLEEENRRKEQQDKENEHQREQQQSMEAAIAAAQQRARIEEENRNREQQQQQQQQAMEEAIAAAQQQAQIEEENRRKEQQQRQKESEQDQHQNHQQSNVYGYGEDLLPTPSQSNSANWDPDSSHNSGMTLSTHMTHMTVKRMVRSAKPAKRASLLGSTGPSPSSLSLLSTLPSRSLHNVMSQRFSLQDEEEANAVLAQQSRRKLDEELVHMERAIGKHRRMSLEFQACVVPEVVPKVSQASFRNSTTTSTNNKQSRTDALQQRKSLEEEIRAMEEAIAYEKQMADAKLAEVQKKNSLQAEIRAMEEAIAKAQADAAAVAAANKEKEQQQQLQQIPEATAPSKPPRFDLMDSIIQSAAAREQRLEDGDIIMQDIAPEVSDKQMTPAFSVAEMVSQKARERDDRIEQGGELKMTTIKPKEEYKEEYKNIVLEAAELGRLTKLNEYVVEAVAQEKTQEQEWRSSGLLAIQWKTNHMAVIHQAAAFGAATKLQEKVVTNFPEDKEPDFYSQDYEEPEKPMTPHELQQLKLNSKAGTGQHKVENLVKKRKESVTHNGLVQPMYSYDQIDELVLPKKELPRIDPRRARERNMQRKKQVDSDKVFTDIGNEVASKAWERRARLDRPNCTPKVTEHCSCAYCISPSPYQTFAYKLLREGKLRHEDVPEHEHLTDGQRQAMLRRQAERQKRFAENPYGSDDDPIFEDEVESEYIGVAAQRSKYGSKIDGYSSSGSGYSSSSDNDITREKHQRVARRGRKKDAVEETDDVVLPTSDVVVAPVLKPEPPLSPTPPTPPSPPPRVEPVAVIEPVVVKAPEASIKPSKDPQPGEEGCACVIL